MASNEPSKLQRTIDNICHALFLTESGKPKSASLLYSFCEGILFFALYVLVYLALLPDFQTMLPFLPTAAVEVLNYLFIAVMGTIPGFCLVLLLKKNKQQIPAAYTWLYILVALTLLAMVIMVHWEADAAEAAALFRAMLYAIGYPLIFSAAFGTFVVQLTYKKQQREEEARKPKRPDYYNT